MLMKREQDRLGIEWRKFYRTVIALVVPMALQNLINVGVTAADVIMLGAVGEDALSSCIFSRYTQRRISFRQPHRRQVRRKSSTSLLHGNTSCQQSIPCCRQIDHAAAAAAKNSRVLSHAVCLLNTARCRSRQAAAAPAADHAAPVPGQPPDCRISARRESKSRAPALPIRHKYRGQNPTGKSPPSHN